MKKEEEESDLEKEVSKSEEDESEEQESEGEEVESERDEPEAENEEIEDFEFQQNFIESFNSNGGIRLPDFSEPILERIRKFSPDNLERDLFLTPRSATESKDYEKGKYEGSNYFEDKYDEKTPDYMSKQSEKKDEGRDKSSVNFR